MKPERSVFILDDDTEFCLNLVEALRGLSCRVESAGEIAHIHKMGDYDTVVLDLDLPSTDVFGLLTPLSLIPGAPSVIFASGRGQELLHVAENVGRSSGLNVLGVLEKPFDIGQLTALLAAVDPVVRASPSDRWYCPTAIRSALIEAIDSGTLPVMFQPLVSAKDLSFVGAEALLGNELRGFSQISPSEIIAVAREERNRCSQATALIGSEA